MRKINPQKHGEKRQEILAAAERCFVRDGFQGASIADICKEAAISPGHLYHYFAGKETIIKAIAEQGLERALARMSEMMQSANAMTALAAEVERHRANSDRARDLFLLDMLAEAGRNPAVAKIVHEQSRKLRAMLAQFLRQAQARGHVDQSLDPDIAAGLLISVIDGTNSMTIRNPKVNLVKSARQLHILITRFLSPAAPD